MSYLLGRDFCCNSILYRMIGDGGYEYQLRSMEHAQLSDDGSIERYRTALIYNRATSRPQEKKGEYGCSVNVITWPGKRQVSTRSSHSSICNVMKMPGGRGKCGITSWHQQKRRGNDDAEVGGWSRGPLYANWTHSIENLASGSLKLLGSKIKSTKKPSLQKY